LENPIRLQSYKNYLKRQHINQKKTAAMQKKCMAAVSSLRAAAMADGA